MPVKRRRVIKKRRPTLQSRPKRKPTLQSRPKITRKTKPVGKKRKPVYKKAKPKTTKKKYTSKDYNPFALDVTDNPENTALFEHSMKQFKKGVKAIGQKRRAKKQTRKNIKSMAKTSFKAELKKTKTLPIEQRGYNNAFNRAERAYRKTKKGLKKQIPRKYR
jgi:hypothetical protein